MLGSVVISFEEHRATLTQPLPLLDAEAGAGLRQGIPLPITKQIILTHLILWLVGFYIMSALVGLFYAEVCLKSMFYSKDSVIDFNGISTRLDIYYA